MTNVPKYESADVERAAFNRQAHQQMERPFALSLNEAGPGDADCAMTEAPNSELKCKSTDVGRAALNGQEQRRRVKPFAPRFNEAEPGDAERATTDVPNSEPKCKSTDAGRAARNGQAQRRKEPPVEPRLNEAGPGNADCATTEVPHPQPKYEPTDAERAMLDRQAQRQKEQPVALRLKVVADYRGVRVELDHPDPDIAHSLLKESFGTVSDDFCLGLLGQMYEFVGIEDSPRVEAELNFLLSMIINGKPKDEVDTTFLYQMGVTSVVQNRFIQKTTRIEHEFMAIERDLRDKKFSRMINEKNYSLIENLSRLMDSTERGFSRFARIFSMLSDTLDRRRRSGEPSMTVQQLTVGSGGQAIVGHITHATPQAAPNNPTAGPRAITDQQHSAMPIIGEPDRVAVPVRRRKMQ